jgi:uncharacterized protein YciU (UPF0263 family)
VAGPVQAATPAPVKVTLQISAREEFKAALRQFFTTELPSRGPVQFVETGADWTLEVVTTEVKDAKGATIAVGLSFLVERHGIHTQMLAALAQACRYFLATGLMKDAPLEQDMKLLLRGVDVLPRPEGLAVVSQHKMCVVTPDRVPQACRDMIAVFNAERFGTPIANAGAPTSSAEGK